MQLKCYNWQAIDRFQQKQSGKMVVETAEIAHQQLLNRGFQQIKLQRNWQLPLNPKSQDISSFLTQLATLLQSAVTLKDSLQIILKNCKHIVLNQWIRVILQHIESGLPFSQALIHVPKLLNYQERQLIKIGEMSGKLADVCKQLAKHRYQQLKLQQKRQKILLYPMMVLSISVILTLLLLLFVVPQFAEMYNNNNAELPFFTQLLLDLSSLLAHYFGSLIFLTVAIIFLLNRQLQRSLKMQKIKTELISHTPILGKIIQLSRLVGFCRSLHLMLNSGVPLQQALNTFLPLQESWQTDPNIEGDWVLNTQINLILTGLQQGYTLSETVSSTLFPEEAQQMLQIGEKSGNLTEMLHHIADNYHRQLEHQIDLLSQLLEPFLMLIIGGLIGLIMLGMYMPIFTMGSVIQ
ncbi:MAG: type II secretion system F family protein [Lonepinella koalarum]|nr:type II secretion system F family protein [Lonepinella koalarum]